jgi:PKHD-type hydroxylase
MVFSSTFSLAECGLILEYAARLKLRRGRIMDAGPECRRSEVGWFDQGPDTTWIYDKLASIFRAVNRWYQYDLVGFVEKLQFTVYNAGDEFRWHLDTGSGPTSTRKLSMSVQLSDGDQYDGGQLEFCGTKPMSFSRERGTVIVFPSFLPHRVCTLTRGVRHALVAWAHGPPFR